MSKPKAINRKKLVAFVLSIIEKGACLSVAGMGRSYEHLPQRQIFHEIQQVHPASTGGGAERLHAGGHRSRTDTGISGTLHRQHGLLQTDL